MKGSTANDLLYWMSIFTGGSWIQTKHLYINLKALELVLAGPIQQVKLERQRRSWLVSPHSVHNLNGAEGLGHSSSGTVAEAAKVVESTAHAQQGTSF